MNNTNVIGMSCKIIDSFRNYAFDQALGSDNWTFPAGFYAGGKSAEEAVYRIADCGDSEGRGSRGGVAQLARKHGTVPAQGQRLERLH